MGVRKGNCGESLVENQRSCLSRSSTRMANVKTTYQEAYCTEPKKSVCRPDVVLCMKPLDHQPVGGPWAVTRKADEVARIAQRLPACDEAFFTKVYSEADRGTHRIEPAWRDPRWTDAMRADNSTLYEPAQRDPPNRGNWYVYRSTMGDPLNTPCQHLTVPDVHKLRYMHGNYMTPDDWYD